jgi:glucose/arabinose dehydrogenase
LYFAQQDGIVRIFRNGALVTQPFLDIRSKTRGGGERGLLGLAFPPAFAQKQRFYVNYTDLNGDTVIAQYRLSANPDIADAASETVLLKITQPFANHNGGQLRFGPDGYLYIGMGDGGSGGDPMNNGQSLGTLLGKILRLDVESAPGRVQIPPDNPFVNRAGARPEIWAYGLRNPWRFTFDRATRDLWIADVGQNTYEEIDFQPAGSRGGENYGWNLMEGLHCFLGACSTAGLTLPVAEYTHVEGCSVLADRCIVGLLRPDCAGSTSTVITAADGSGGWSGAGVSG